MISALVIGYSDSKTRLEAARAIEQDIRTAKIKREEES